MKGYKIMETYKVKKKIKRWFFLCDIFNNYAKGKNNILMYLSDI